MRRKQVVPPAGRDGAGSGVRGDSALPEEGRLMSMRVGDSGMSMAFGRGQCHMQGRADGSCLGLASTSALAGASSP